ncbi:hypothetical protein HN935_03795 [archaeon]|nr:hypothetical protein [archaeon]
MKIHHVFYAVGIAFIFLSAIYFAAEFIANLDDTIKLILLIVSVVVTFTVGELMREANI